MALPRIVVDAADLRAALRRRILFELNSTFESCDAVAGLAARYTQKLLANEPMRRASLETMLLLCQATGLRITLDVDPTFDRRLAHRYTRRKMVVRGEQRAAAKVIEGQGDSPEVTPLRGTSD